jgi:hypothetical protein
MFGVKGTKFVKKALHHQATNWHQLPNLASSNATNWHQLPNLASSNATNWHQLPNLASSNGSMFGAKGTKFVKK